MDLTDQEKVEAAVYLRRIAHIATRPLNNKRSLIRLKKEINDELFLMDEFVIKAK